MSGMRDSSISERIGAGAARNGELLGGSRLRCDASKRGEIESNGKRYGSEPAVRFRGEPFASSFFLGASPDSLRFCSL